MIRWFSQKFVTKRFQTETSSIFLIGVERYNMEHCLQLAEYLSIMKPNCILTQIPSDDPSLIYTKANVRETWNKYIQGFPAQFLVSPRPSNLQDIILNSEKVSKFLIGALINSSESFFISSNIVYAEHNSFYAKVRKSTLQPDCFVTGLLYHSNNTSTTTCSVISDMSELVFRDNLVRKISLEDMIAFFEQFIWEIEQENYGFDPKSLKPDLMIKPKADYIAEIIKQTSRSYKLIVGIVESDLIYDIETAWKSLTKEPKTLKEFLTISEPSEACTMTEYTEKHAMLDLMLGPFIQEYFVKHNFFPYTAHGIIGIEEGLYSSIKEGWDYYYKTHSERLTKIINDMVSASHSKTKSPKFKRPKSFKPNPNRDNK
jgi:hypothetical protein